MLSTVVSINHCTYKKSCLSAFWLVVFVTTKRKEQIHNDLRFLKRDNTLFNVWVGLVLHFNLEKQAHEISPLLSNCTARSRK